MNPLTEILRIIREEGLEAYGRYYGIYRGIVVSNEDPEYIMRLKIKCPAAYGEEIFDEWVYPKGIPVGTGFGLYGVPVPGDIIWVQFENGDTDNPIWSYGHFKQGEGIAEAKVSGNPNYVFQSPAGQRIAFYDKDEKVKIFQKDGIVIEMSKKGFSFSNGTDTLGTLMESLFGLFEQTKTATSIGSQPFMNLPDYVQLKEKFKKLLY